VIIDGLVRRGSANVDGDAVRRERRAPVITLSPLEQTLVERFRAWGVSPQSPKEVAVDPAARQALDRLLSGGQLVKVKPDLYVAAEVASSLRARLLAHLEAHGQITPQEWKDLTGATRKYSIPLAEYFDAEKVTLRVGDVRRRRG
jgi:selenocysteine-specific elongation factor